MSNLPVITLQSVASDVNASFSSGTYADSNVVVHSPDSIRFTPSASGGATIVTIDLTGSPGTNSRLQKFVYDKKSLFGFLLKIDAPAAFSPNKGDMEVVLTNQAHRVAPGWFSTGDLRAHNERPGWFFLTLSGDTNGAVDTSEIVQNGFSVDGATSNKNRLVNNPANLVDSVRFEVDTAATNNTATNSVYLDSMWLNPAFKPTLMLHFDDGYPSEFSEGASYMATKGLRGTVGVVSSLVGTSGFMNITQLQQLYNTGWDLVNHSNTHIDASTKEANSISGGPGAIIKSGATAPTNGSIGTAAFDAPRHIVIVSDNNDWGRPFTVAGLDEHGQPQTDIVYGKTPGYSAVSETIWTKINSVTNSSTTDTVGNIQVGTSYSQQELFDEYKTCQTFLKTNGWVRGSNLAIYPYGMSTLLLDRALASLGINCARNVAASAIIYAYPNLPGYNPMQIPGYGGGGLMKTGVTMITSADIYNSGGSGAFSGKSFPTPTTTKWAKYTRWKLVIQPGATMYNVMDTDGNPIGSGRSGRPFSHDGIKFTFTVGTSIAGDTFYINIGSNMTTLLKEVIARQAACVAYLHVIRRDNNGATTLETNRSDFRTFIDAVADDVKKGRVSCPTFSEYYASLL
jgi:hypothetical protein